MESGTVNAVGVWFYSLATQRYLYLMRDDTRHPNTWGLPGGKVEAAESLIDAIKRECDEEIGFMPDYVRLVPLEQFTTPDGVFAYHTFFCCVDQEFQPQLNQEHIGYAWIDRSTWPRPMHPGLWNTVNFDVVREKVEIIRNQISQ
jgi:8-oxo-dGTP pyrophosphatase MutT (NUDIX family)